MAFFKRENHVSGLDGSWDPGMDYPITPEGIKSWMQDNAPKPPRDDTLYSMDGTPLMTSDGLSLLPEQTASAPGQQSLIGEIHWKTPEQIQLENRQADRPIRFPGLKAGLDKLFGKTGE